MKRGKNHSKSKKYKPQITKDEKSKVSQPPSSSGAISSNWLQMKNILSKGNVTKKTNYHSLYKRKRKISDCDDAKVGGSAEKSKKLEVWFDDVDVEDIKKATGDDINGQNHQSSLESTNKFKDLSLGGFSGLTKRIAIDCEFVGVGWDGKRNMLARVSIVNSHGYKVYDKYVLPQEKVTDYRTSVSGIQPSNLKNGVDFKTVQNEVADMLKGRILIGHAVQNDLKVLLLDHPKKNIRDTSRYKPFHKQVKSSKPSLKKLSKEILHTDIQQGEHCSVQDAQAAMKLYILHKNQWEKQIKERKFK